MQSRQIIIFSFLLVIFFPSWSQILWLKWYWKCIVVVVRH